MGMEMLRCVQLDNWGDDLGMGSIIHCEDEILRFAQDDSRQGQSDPSLRSGWHGCLLGNHKRLPYRQPAKVEDEIVVFRAVAVNDYRWSCKLKAEYISPKKRLGTVASNRVCMNPFWRASVSHVW